MGRIRAPLLIRLALLALLVAAVATHARPSARVRGSALPLGAVVAALRSAGYAGVTITRDRWGEVANQPVIHAYDPHCADDIRIDQVHVTPMRPPQSTAPGTGQLIFYGRIAARDAGGLRIVGELLWLQGRYVLRLAPRRPPPVMLVLTGSEACLVPRVDLSRVWVS